MDTLKPDNELIELCQKILDEEKRIKEWEETTYEDMFQSEKYYVGYDPELQKFMFSYFLIEVFIRKCNYMRSFFF